MFEEQSATDVTIKVGVRSVKCHKTVLRNASKVFDAMFDHEMQESSTNVIEIDDIDFGTVRAMLRFIYGDTTIGKSLATNLLHAADKYELDALKVSK